MARRADLIRWAAALLVALTVLALAGTGLFLASDATVGRARLGPYYPALLVLAALLALVLAAVIALQLIRLWRALRQRQAGARLNGRLFLLFAALSLLPALLVFAFGLNFLFGAVDSRFAAPVAAALDDALAVGHLYLEERQDAAGATVTELAAELADSSRGSWQERLDEAVDRSGALQLTVFSTAGAVIAHRSADPDWLQPEAPDESQRLRVQASGRSGRAQVEQRNEQLALRALARIPLANPLESAALLQAVFPVPARYAPLAQRIEATVVQHRQLAFLRDALKLSMALILGLVLLLVLLAALLLALRASRRLVTPVAQLAAAAGDIARGHYHPVQTLPQPDDELGDLVGAFNRMADELRGAQASVRENQAMLEGQRAYLDAVLARISSAVVGFGRDGRVRLLNPTGEQLLAVQAGEVIGLDPPALAQQHPHLTEFARRVGDRLDRVAAGPWREEIRLSHGEGARALLLRGSPLIEPEGGRGLLVVFDDATDLNRAQREAAWTEVARRLAHEIKNPLTPIQLAAERLRRRYLGKLPPEDSEVLERATGTIVNQVEALKHLVNAFSDYARPTPAKRERIVLNALVNDVLELYAQDPRLRIDRVQVNEEILLRADPDQLRQVLHNLIKNGIEANTGEGLIRIEVGIERITATDGIAHAHIWVRDHGAGLPPGFDLAAAEPYRSDKPRGSGLGLVIVQRIVAEHGGRIEAANAADGGARFTLILPL